MSSNGICGHVDGGVPTTCRKYQVSGKDTCEASCTMHQSCIGYIYQRSKGFCGLIIADNMPTCPTGFYKYRGFRTAYRKNDLVPKNSSFKSGFVCYGKNSDIIIQSPTIMI